MKIYSKNTWVDEILSGLQRYNILDNGGTLLNSNIQIVLSTAVTTPGTTADASHMNNLENGIDGLDTKVSGMEVHPATSKATPVDADEIGLLDSASSFAQVKLTWANLKATLKTYLDTLYTWATNTHAAPSKTTPASADEFGLLDSANSYSLAKLTYTNLKNDLKTVLASLTQPIKETSGPTLLTTGTIADGQFLQRSGSNLIGAMPIVGKVVNIFSGTSTYTPSTGARALYVECIGGGGAGGGAASGSSSSSIGGGGGSGGYSAVLLNTSLKGSYTVAVGLGGTAGAAGSAGNAGGDTSFDTGPSVCVAKGGSGGAVLAAGTTVVIQNGAAGGSLTGAIGTVMTPGANGGWGLRTSGTTGHAGDGGDAPIGGGTAQGASAAGAGGAGAVYGGGGGGGLSTSAAQVGGVGAAGMIRITEMF